MIFYKIILGIIIASTNILCLASEDNKPKEQQEAVLTMEEVEEFLHKVTTDEPIKKNFHYYHGYYSEYRNTYDYEFILDPAVHTKKGWKEIVICVNNHITDCMHPALNMETTKKFSYGDLYIDGDYNELEFDDSDKIDWIMEHTRKNE